MVSLKGLFHAPTNIKIKIILLHADQNSSIIFLFGPADIRTQDHRRHFILALPFSIHGAPFSRMDPR